MQIPLDGDDDGGGDGSGGGGEGGAVRVANPELEQMLARVLFPVGSAVDAADAGDAGSGRGAEMEHGVDLLLRTLTTILCLEPVLERLKTLQQRDVIDVEGAEIVYEQLLKVAGSAEIADRMLESSMYSKCTRACVSPLPPPLPSPPPSPSALFRDSGADFAVRGGD